MEKSVYFYGVGDGCHAVPRTTVGRIENTQSARTGKREVFSISPYEKMATQFCGGPDLLPQKITLFVLGAPNSGTLVYLVPLARSRYCASPEASIMRLKAAPTLKNYELIT